MPTYDYECPKCGVFEVFHGMNETYEKCETCGAKVRKVPTCATVKMDEDYSSENGGKGRYRGDFAKYPGDPNAYVSSRKDFVNKLKATDTPYVTGI